ncbi:MAG: UDP-N-acetylmuramoyl-tripeptide--D-alanyl-D-alanine ligase [Dysgonamonadaceae bacterium]|nr:UDP-N-acetylmuramoyl-tripeptide--D-alanyl-D-alanine ligase [Dysgonamonadaceae bacterium]MDD4727999.1 UDP-N-acetylmuramoyl-tripeptide--D-alanyl-D-alanine ligase [Dysgonamonadaceae bacterium]
MLIPELYTIYKQHPVITTDSRVCPDGAIFFALKGPTFNGNNFAEEAVKKGCSYAVVDEWNEHKARPEYIILVDDVLTVLQKLANHHRKQLKTPLIAITGTNGKTTTKELVAAVLSKEFKVLYTQGNFNNHIGVPLTLLSMTKEHEIAVIEMGASHRGDIKELCEIAAPNFGLITNIGVAHIEGFGSVENIVKTKTELFDYLEQNNGKAFVNRSLKDALSLPHKMDMNEYGVDNPSLFVSGSIVSNYPYLEFDWQFFEHRHHVKTHLVGDYNMDNALAAITIGVFFGINAEFINDALEAYTPKNSRSQFEKTEKNTLIIDAYNANPTSMKAAVNNFVEYPLSPKALIIGEMKELGGVTETEHQQLLDLIKAHSFNHVFLVGKSFENLDTDFPIYENVGDLIQKLISDPLSDFCILIKGSNGVQLDKVVTYL